jgi:hypothetical protein
MGVYLRRFTASMTQQILNVVQINAFFQQVCSEGVPQGGKGAGGA